MNRLRITEIFHSLQGETRTVGLPTAFVRLTGCPLRCQYCDTEYAFHGGRYMDVQSILKKISEYGVQYVTVTGGEPLAQPACISLLSALCDKNYAVSLETSGALSVENVDPRVVKVLDIKTPGSCEVDKNLWDNIKFMRSHDQIKFVICNKDDYEWSKSILQKYKLSDVSEILFSPSYEQLSSAQLAEWILKDKLNVRFQLQMHKTIWGDVQGK